MNMYHVVNTCSKAHVPFQDSRTLKGSGCSFLGFGMSVGLFFCYLNSYSIFLICNFLQTTLHFFLHTCPWVCVCEGERDWKRRRRREREKKRESERHDTLVSYCYRKFNTCQHKSETDSFGRKNKFTHHSKQRMRWDLKNRRRVGRHSTI